MTELKGRRWRQAIRKVASLKIAVAIIIWLAVVTAWGTIVEAQYDAFAAKKLVYDTWWMYLPLSALCLSLTAVMVDRWPWKPRHLGFIMAHIGIITLLVGAWITSRFGVDGSISLGPGESQGSVSVGETDLVVYSSMDGQSYRPLYNQEVDFFTLPAQDNPVSIPIPEGEIRVVESMNYGMRDSQFVASKEESSGAAVRLQLENANVNLTQWVLQPSRSTSETRDLGPAQISIVPEFPRSFGGRNAILFKPIGPRELGYEIHSAKTGSVKRGRLTAGAEVETGWMGLKLRVLKYFYQAKEEIRYKPLSRPSELTSQAIRIEYRTPGSAELKSQWMGLGSLLKLYSDDQVYVLSFANRKIPMGFKVKLKDFRVGRYQGTVRAASYESLVEVPEAGEALISMNEPLKHGGFTFYQASFNSDDAGRPVASILSVNWDPGRGIKYLGSALIVLGTMHLFYLKRRSWLKTAETEQTANG